MNRLELIQCEGRVFGFDVEDLAADHSEGTRSARKLLDEQHRMARRVRREKLERQSNHRIPGEDGHCFAEDLVIGRPPPAKIVIVHCRKIVVDERERVDQLHRGGGGDCGGFILAIACAEAFEQ